MVTTDCSGCNHEKIFINKNENIKEVKLFWDKEKCLDQINLIDDIEVITKRSTSIINHVDEQLVSRNFNSYEKSNIKSDMTRSIRERDGVNNQDTFQKNLLHAYYTIWYAYRSRYKLSLYDTKECINKIDNILEDKNNSCFIPPYEAHKKYKGINSTINAFLNDYIFQRDSQEYENLSDIKKEVNNIFNKYQKINKEFSECKNVLRLMEESSKFQESYCLRRKITIFSMRLIWVLSFISIGIAIGAWIARGDKNKNGNKL